MEYLAWNIIDGDISPKVNSIPLREQKLLLQARERLLLDLSNPPTIAELSREVGLNQLKLKTGFKIFFGNSIYAMFLEERMKQARQLLKTHNVMETALILGYSNVSHFSKAFKQHYAMTPGQYRKH